MEDWVNKQVEFSYGKWYQDVLQKNYSNIELVKRQLLPNRRIAPFSQNFIEFFRTIRPDVKAEDIIVDFRDNVEHNNFIITCKRKAGSNNQVLFPTCVYLHPRVLKSCLNYDIPFEKKENKIIWRGATTNVPNSDGTRWSRYDIVKKFYKKNPSIDVAFHNVVQDYEEFHDDVYELLDGTLEPVNMLKAKYLLCLEGNDVAANFNWVLASNSVPLHTYPFCSESPVFCGLEPYVHFIPVKGDGSDLEEKYQWCLDHDEECKKIAQNGKDHMKYFLDEGAFNKYIETVIKLYPAEDDKL